MEKARTQNPQKVRPTKTTDQLLDLFPVTDTELLQEASYIKFE